MQWIHGTYDHELNLYYLGNPATPAVLAGASSGDNLYTCRFVALNRTPGEDGSR